MSIRWSLSMLERELNNFYDQTLALEDFSLLRLEQVRIAGMFLSVADQFFQVNFSLHGQKMVYTYYFQDKLFAKIDLWQCPEFEKRDQFIQWFVDQIRIGRESLQLPN